MSLGEAAIGLKAYKEVEERMIQLWHNIDAAIVSPRMDIDNFSLPGVYVDDVCHFQCGVSVASDIRCSAF
jgi:protein transport protein DSL1/ZW10